MSCRLCRLGLSLILAMAASAAAPGWSQTCTWGGTPTVPPPPLNPLWTDRELLRSPSRVAADGAGNAYVTDPGAGRVFVRDSWGRLLSVKQGLAQPLAVAVDSFGTIYVAEAGTGSVSAFGSSWDRRFKLGRGDGEFVMPNHMTIDPEPSFQRLYVVDSGANTVKVYSLAGSLLFEFGEAGAKPGQFNFPAGIHVSPEGEVFVADQNNDRVQVFDRGGSFLRCFGGSSTQRFGRIQGVAGDREGRVYVADAFQSFVWAFEPSGAQLGRVGSIGEGPGELLGPGGIALDSNNRLLVASTGNGRVAAYGLDGFANPRAAHGTATFLPPKPGPISPWTIACVEIPGLAIDQVRRESLAANGIPTNKPLLGWCGGDEGPDIVARFERAALLATFAADAWSTGEGFVGVTGELVDGTPFEATAVLDLRSEAALEKQREHEKQKGKRRPGPARLATKEALR